MYEICSDRWVSLVCFCLQDICGYPSFARGRCLYIPCCGLCFCWAGGTGCQPVGPASHLMLPSNTSVRTLAHNVTVRTLSWPGFIPFTLLQLLYRWHKLMWRPTKDYTDNLGRFHKPAVKKQNYKLCSAAARESQTFWLDVTHRCHCTRTSHAARPKTECQNRDRLCRSTKEAPGTLCVTHIFVRCHKSDDEVSWKLWYSKGRHVYVRTTSVCFCVLLSAVSSQKCIK